MIKVILDDYEIGKKKLEPEELRILNEGIYTSSIQKEDFLTIQSGIVETKSLYYYPTSAKDSPCIDDITMFIKFSIQKDDLYAILVCYLPNQEVMEVMSKVNIPSIEYELFTMIKTVDIIKLPAFDKFVRHVEHNIITKYLEDNYDAIILTKMENDVGILLLDAETECIIGYAQGFSTVYAGHAIKVRIKNLNTKVSTVFKEQKCITLLIKIGDKILTLKNLFFDEDNTQQEDFIFKLNGEEKPSMSYIKDISDGKIMGVDIQTFEEVLSNKQGTLLTDFFSEYNKKSTEKVYNNTLDSMIDMLL